MALMPSSWSLMTFETLFTFIDRLRLLRALRYSQGLALIEAAPDSYYRLSAFSLLRFDLTAGDLSTL